MKFKEIFSIIILFFIYLIALKDTITLYHVPGPEFSIFVRSLSPYILLYVALSEAIILFMPVFLSTLLTIRMSYKKSPPIKIHFSNIIIISALNPILVILNNYTSGILCYSVFLLSYAFVITVMMVWTYLVGKDYPRPSKEDLDHTKMLEGVCSFIMEIDSFRSPVVVGISPYPFNIRFNSFSKQGKKLFFARNSPNLYKKIQKKMDPFLHEGIYSNLLNPSPDEFFLRYSLRYNLNYHRIVKSKGHSNFDRYRFAQVDTGFSFISYLAICLIIILIGIRIMYFIDVYNNNYLFFLILGPFITLYLLFALLSTRRRYIAAKKYENELKSYAQELVDYWIQLIKEYNLDPDDLSIKLRHNNYKGLIYEKKGKNKYIAHIKK